MKHLLSSRLLKTAAFSLMAAFLLSSCTLSLFQIGNGSVPTPAIGVSIPTPTPAPSAEVFFNVTLPAAIPPGSTLSLAVLDEVTGLPINPLYYPMKVIDELHYTANIAVPLNGVIKYRYVLQGQGLPAIEDTTLDLPMRYRIYMVPGPAQVSDIIASWTNQPYAGETGKISGQAINIESGAPLTNILVSAGGVQTMTDSLGNFTLEGLPPGKHNLVGIGLDGAYRPFQQEAVVAPSTTTPAVLGMKAAPMVNMTFLVSVPRDTTVGVPLRMAGNLLQLGNTFGDLVGGVSTVATRMPVLLPVPDGRYSVTLRLPAGTDLRYKYTLGDGLWNAEHFNNGAFRVRQLIVPEQDSIVQDQVDTWQSGPSSPILFQVTVPETTSPNDTVSIQFSPYGWTEPIPMWAIGNNRWLFRLTSPLDMLGSFGYRYCLNMQCGSADDAASAGMATLGRPITTSLTPQDIRDTITAWQWSPVNQEPASAPVVTARAQGFDLGIEFQPSFEPSYTPLYASAMQKVAGYRSNLVILSPTWTVQRDNPLIFAPLPGADPLWGDTLSAVEQARKLNLNVALFPTPRFANAADDWRNSVPADWNAWFERYRGFALYHADLAAASGAQALILGGERVPPALYDGVPEAEDKFRTLIGEVRQHFGGTVMWGFYYPGVMQTPPAFLDFVDGVYLLWNAPLSYNNTPTVDELASQAGKLLDQDILPFAVSLQKTVILGVAYPSISGTASGCIPGSAGGCLDWMAFSRPNPDLPGYQIDLQTQSNIYQAMLSALNDRNWLGGFVSRGFYPPAALADKSASVSGKPASNVLNYWYPRLLGITP